MPDREHSQRMAGAEDGGDGRRFLGGGSSIFQLFSASTLMNSPHCQVLQVMDPCPPGETSVFFPSRWPYPDSSLVNADISTYVAAKAGKQNKAEYKLIVARRYIS